MELLEEVAIILGCNAEDLDNAGWPKNSARRYLDQQFERQRLQGIAYHDFQIAIGQVTSDYRRQQFKRMFILVEKRMMEALTCPNPWVQEWAKLVNAHVQKNGPVGEWIWRQDILGEKK